MGPASPWVLHGVGNASHPPFDVTLADLDGAAVHPRGNSLDSSLVEE
jgi:hypothetical protein